MQISFPGLGLNNLHISRVAFSIFGVEIYWYAILIVSAIIIGMLLLKKKDGLFDISFSTIIDLFIYLIPISFICARIYFILFNLSYYLQNPIQMLNLRDGGLALYGGLIGGVITSYIYCKIKKIDLLNLLDCMVPYLALRTGNWQMGKFL